MNKKKAKDEWQAPEPYAVNPDIRVYYELDFNKEKVTPGIKLKFRNDREIYRFRLWAHNVKTNVQWIDVVSVDGVIRSFYMNDIMKIVKPKRSRRHKPIT